MGDHGVGTLQPRLGRPSGVLRLSGDGDRESRVRQQRRRRRYAERVGGRRLDARSAARPADEKFARGHLFGRRPRTVPTTGLNRQDDQQAESDRCQPIAVHPRRVPAGLHRDAPHRHLRRPARKDRHQQPPVGHEEHDGETRNAKQEDGRRVAKETSSK